MVKLVNQPIQNRGRKDFEGKYIIFNDGPAGSPIASACLISSIKPMDLLMTTLSLVLVDITLLGGQHARSTNICDV